MTVLQKRYNVTKLVYYEIFNNPTDAIKREKQIKVGSRRKKEELINKFNKEWADLIKDINPYTQIASSR